MAVQGAYRWFMDCTGSEPSFKIPGVGSGFGAFGFRFTVARFGTSGFGFQASVQREA